MSKGTRAVEFIFVVAAVVVPIALPRRKNAGRRPVAGDHLTARVRVESRCLHQVAAVGGWAAHFVGRVHTVVLAIAAIHSSNTATVLATLHVHSIKHKKILKV